jgi:surfactin synthase thioesterase subunit
MIGPPQAGEWPEPWVGIARPASRPELRLLAIPYAGGGASAFRRWPDDLMHSDWLSFAALQLPGRENRIGEPLVADPGVILDRLEAAFGQMADMPYVLFGYSLGAALAYGLAVRLTPHRPPRALILAARAPGFRPGAPGRPASERPSREAVVAKVRRLGGVASDVLSSELFDQHFLPILQADFAVADGLRTSVPQILPCPILAFAAQDDPEVSTDDARRWEMVAGGGFDLHLFDGGHFFLHSAHRQVMALLNDRLEGLRP